MMNQFFMSQRRPGEGASPGAEWDALYDNIGTTQNTGWGGYTVRNRLRADDSIILSNTGPYCRLRFSAGPSQQGRINTAFVTTIPDAQTSFAGADWVPVLFGGEAAVTIAAADFLWSDPLFLADWGEEDHEQLLISFWASSSGQSSWRQNNVASSFPGRGSWINSGSTNASDSTGGWSGTSRTEIYAVTGIESILELP